MPRYLWRRPSGWAFQIGIPKASRHLGVSPFRIALGRLDATEAHRRARILAGWATVAMEGSVSRQEVSRGLAALAAELDAIDQQVRNTDLRMLNATSTWREEAEHGASADPDVIGLFRNKEAEHRGRLDVLRSMRTRLEHLGAEIKRDGEGWEAERAAYDRTVDRLASMRESPAVDLPLLSVAAPPIIEAREKAIGTTSGYPARLRRVIRAFVSVVGDKPVDQYMPVDLQTFVTTIGGLPKTWSTDKRLRDLPPLDVIDRAKRIKGLQPISKTTVAEYLAEFRTVWMTIRATYPDHVRALSHEDVHVTQPRFAARPVKRLGLPIEAINAWLTHAAHERRPDDRFLPLLGALTGARLGELVGLQVGDIQPFRDHWTINLIEDVEDEDGATQERQVKTEQSRRLIALPDAIVGTGFIEWVTGLRSGTLWPQLLRSARPHATASKRMMRTMKAVGIHGPGQTFHSLRHGYKDYLRSMKVPERTIDQQVGHAHDSAGASYGAATLRPDEIATIATLPLSDGLDLYPYVGPRSATTRRRHSPRKD
ncbi:tyrosine-type recombinase/integrase [Xanthobacter variabilis]|uniref:tyrosine-type recombinase/integrase n=1 Tax=Xanthobacter variabilis TaxID=3119932 RepID=UPI0037278BB1